MIVADVWDGQDIKLSFRRIFDPAMMEAWYCMEQIILGTKLSEDEDALIWQYEAKGEYTTGSIRKQFLGSGIPRIEMRLAIIYFK